MYMPFVSLQYLHLFTQIAFKNVCNKGFRIPVFKKKVGYEDKKSYNLQIGNNISSFLFCLRQSNLLSTRSVPLKVQICSIIGLTLLS